VPYTWETDLGGAEVGKHSAKEPVDEVDADSEETEEVEEVA
jgi:hypothetical protein